MSINFDDREFKKLAQDLKDMPQQVMAAAGPVMKSKTPIRSGNARGKTNYRSGTTTVLADYDYADRLDNGWSRQAPQGFTDPTIDFIEREIDRQIGRM